MEGALKWREGKSGERVKVERGLKWREGKSGERVNGLKYSAPSI